MIEKVIVDSNLIRKIINRNAIFLIIQYNPRNKRAWYQTDGMSKRHAIDISRVVNI